MKNCKIEKFLKRLTKNAFNEDLTYDERRKFFIQHSMENVLVFNDMYSLQLKGKEKVEKIKHLIATSEYTHQKQKDNSEELKRLMSKKYLIQKKIEDLLEKIYTK